jgi:hypothetical protein
MLLMVLLAVGACDTEGVPEPLNLDLSASLDSAFEVGPSFGHDSTTPGASFFRVRSADMSDDGTRLLVVDDAPPFVRIFDDEGRFQRGLFPEGEGPSEATSILSAAFGPENEVLALKWRSLALVDTAGDLSATLPLTGVRGLELVRGCGGWVLYGPQVGIEKERAPTWVWVVRTSQAGELDLSPLASLRDEYVRNQHRPGWLHGISASDDSVIVTHRYPEARGSYLISCDGGRVQRSQFLDPVVEQASLPQVQNLGGSAEGLTTAVGKPFPTGRIDLGHQSYAASGFFRGESFAPFTHLAPIDGGGVPLVFAGGIRFLSSHSRLGMLVARSRPVPEVTLIQMEELRRILSNGS